jgi:two-component system cell cycle sensor histidine kinase/response regulator CckA
MKPTLRILHLEDNQTDAQLVRELLDAEGINCAVTCVKTREAYEQALETEKFDLILTDFSLPRFDGLSALALAREKRPETPTIFISGTMGEEAAVRCLQQGATDYVLKDRLARLPSAVRRAVAETEEMALRQKAEDKIREQAALLDKAQDAIMVRDLEDRIIYWNKSAERLYGWSAEEVVGRDATQFFCVGDSPQHKRACQHVLEDGEWVGELRQLTRTGKPIIVESRWTLVREKAGVPKAKLIINTDVTERRKLEAQLLRAQRLETIGALAGGIAHDLNNVLAPILIGTQVLGAEPLGGDARKVLETMRARAQRGAEMIQQILSFARGVGGEPAVLDIKNSLAEVQTLAGETFPRSIRIQVKVPQQLYAVKGNATQLHQVLLNLCVNARDAMPNGGSLCLAAQNVALDKTITRWQPEPVSGPFVRISVSDTGHGIPPELLDQIFEPFFTTKELGKGTGLGLSTVLGIVKSHGGFLDVASAADKGTTFEFYLPAHSPEQRPAV